MISDVYQTVLSAYTLNGPDTGPDLHPDIVFAHTTVFVPPHANFSAQICLCEYDFLATPPPAFPVSEAWATPYILRYLTYTPEGGLTSTFLTQDVSTVNNIQNGYLIIFGLRVWASNSFAFASAVGTIFIQS